MAQEGVTTFGIQFKPVIPLGFFDPKTTLTRPHMEGSIDLTGGLSFGMVIRRGITKSISIETGLNQITRRYNVALMVDSANFSADGKIRLVGYELPILGLVYIRLGQKTWMNNAIGFSLDTYPSDIERSWDDARLDLYRTNWIQVGVVGNIGVEYRTDKAGIFYLGATYHRPFGNVVEQQFEWRDHSGFIHRLNGDLSGTYLTFDIRYFFHEDPERRAARRSKKTG